MRFLTGLLIFGALSAQNYQTIASNAQLMKGVQKPSMDALAAMSKAGGPKDDAEWAQAEQAAALLAETTQILLMGDRPKDQDVWVKTANRVLAAAKASAVAAKAKDLEAWKPTLGQMGGGCRGCHDVHRPKKPV